MVEQGKDLSQHNMEVFRDSSDPESQKGKKNSKNSDSSSLQVATFRDRYRTRIRQKFLALHSPQNKEKYWKVEN